MGDRVPGDRQRLEALDDGRKEPDDRAQLFEELALPALDGLYAFACPLEGLDSMTSKRCDRLHGRVR